MWSGFTVSLREDARYIIFVLFGVSPGSLRAGIGVGARGQGEVDRALVLLLSVYLPPVLGETLLTAELVVTGADCVEDSSRGVTLSLTLSTYQHCISLNILSLLSH